jgi:hypothetical protein
MPPSGSETQQSNRAPHAAAEPGGSEQARGTEQKAPAQPSPNASAETEKKPWDSTNMLKELAETATGVVARAASILEEEIAAGVVAAKNVESRFVDVKASRSGKPEEVLPRFRRDAHEVVDILMDLVNVATRTVSGFTQSVIKISGEATPGKDARTTGPAHVPTVSPTESGHAGGTAELSMSLENDGDTPTEEFAFHATDLVNPAGDRIAAAHITFTPISIVIPPHDRARLAIKIAVPEGTSAGVYTGVLQATRLSQLRAMLLVPIE